MIECYFKWPMSSIIAFQHLGFRRVETLSLLKVAETGNATSDF